MKRNIIALGLVLGILTTSCNETAQNTETKTEKAETTDQHMSHYANDTHSFGEPNKVAATKLHLELLVDFDEKILSGSAQYELERYDGNELVLDVKNLSIQGVTDANGKVLSFEIKTGDKQGDALVIALNDDTKMVNIAYNTNPNSDAVLWMEPAQTLGKTAPFLFTQGQAVLTRSWVPVQDSPAVRITYTAKVKVPKGMLAVMSASNPTEMNESSEYTFEMNQPIPPYLMALAVGDLRFKSLGERSGVYAEPAMLEKAAYEFGDVENMIAAAEALYGPYRWEQYDILVLPPSFPFGGMENPRLTFATPTIIAGDRSLTSLIAHELAHSWSGNLVTNATWDDFWLNEGFTVYFEKRIMESLYGHDYAEMLNVLGTQDLEHTIAELGPESADTHLKLDLDGRDPDDGMTDIAYEKGYLFLRWLEEMVGRPTFDAFLKNYFDSNAFKTMTTESFIVYLEANLLDDMETRPDIESWIYKPGLPADHPVPVSDRFDNVDAARLTWESGSVAADKLETEVWSTHEWLHFLRGISDEKSAEDMASLDAVFDFTNTGNSEIAAAWFQLAIENDYQVAFPALEDFLMTVGRRKFLKPLYEGLAKTDAHKTWALEVYGKARNNYHVVSVNTIDELLDYEA